MYIHFLCTGYKGFRYQISYLTIVFLSSFVFINRCNIFKALWIFVVGGQLAQISFSSIICLLLIQIIVTES